MGQDRRRDIGAANLNFERTTSANLINARKIKMEERSMLRITGTNVPTSLPRFRLEEKISSVRNK